MNIKIIEENCIGCGICQSECEAVFQVEDIAKIIGTVTNENKESVLSAIEICPTSAIVEVTE